MYAHSIKSLDGNKEHHNLDRYYKPPHDSICPFRSSQTDSNTNHINPAEHDGAINHSARLSILAKVLLLSLQNRQE